MTGKKWMGVPAWLLALRLVLPAQGAAPIGTPPAGKPPLRKALERSLLFPGLGQLGEKQYLKAAFFGGAELFCLAQVLILMGKGKDAYRNYRDAVDPAWVSEYRAQTEKYDKQRNTAILAAAAVWALNMVDILIYAKKKYGRKTTVGFQPYYRHENKAIGAGLRLHF